MRYRTLPLTLLACMLLLPSIVFAWQGRVTDVKEANTLVVRTEGQERVVSLYGIGVPEDDEPFAKKARSFVHSTTFRQRVEVEPLGTGGGIRAMVYVQGDDDSINAKILRQGLGWLREAYCEKAKLCGRLNSISGEARRSERNLWAEVPGNKAAWKWLKEQDRRP